MDGAEVQLADVLAELQAIHGDMAALSTHEDIAFVAAFVALLAGIVLGAAVAACFRGGLRGG